MNCTWSNWEAIGPCSEKCGGGFQTFKRTKIEQERNNGICDGVNEELRSCNNFTCPCKYFKYQKDIIFFVVLFLILFFNQHIYFSIYLLVWCEWNEPKPCSKTCGGGMQTTTRDCNCPPPSKEGIKEGIYCEGNSYYVSGCNIQKCPGMLRMYLLLM